MTKKTKGSDEAIKIRRRKLLSIVKDREITTQKQAKKLLLENYGIKVTIPTISRDFNELNIKQSESGRYMISANELRKLRQFELTDILVAYTTNPFKDSINVFCINVEPGFGDYVGTKIMESFSGVFIGYLTSNNLLMLISDDVNKATDAKALLREMTKGYYVDDYYGMNKKK